MSQATDDAIRLLNREGYAVFRRSDRHITSQSVGCRIDAVQRVKDDLLRRFPAVRGLEARVEHDGHYSGDMMRVTVGMVYYPDTAEARPEGVDVTAWDGYRTRPMVPLTVRPQDVGQRVVFDHNPTIHPRGFRNEPRLDNNLAFVTAHGGNLETLHQLEAGLIGGHDSYTTQVPNGNRLTLHRGGLIEVQFPPPIGDPVVRMGRR